MATSPSTCQVQGQTEAPAALPVPYEVLRAWPAEWDLTPLLLSTASGLPEPGPLRYLHPALEVRTVPGRGRGVFATSSVEAGELLLLDSPLVTASTYNALLEAIDSRAQTDEPFRRALLSMCGDPADEATRAAVDIAPATALVRNIVRHNYHGVDASPKDGEVPEGPPSAVGLWPLGSLVNHSLSPNATRTFAGHCSCYRLIKPLQAGSEVLDNYLDLRLPHAVRQDLLRKNHGIEDEGPDQWDAPAEVLAAIQADHASTISTCESGTKEAIQAGFMKLAELTNRCMDVGKKDPAFTDVFRDFALAAGQQGGALQLGGPCKGALPDGVRPVAWRL